MRSQWIIGIALVLILAGAALTLWPSEQLSQSTPAPTTTTLTQTTLPTADSIEPTAMETVADGLEIPWELVFLPDSSMLVTERPGRLLKIGEDKSVIPINGVQHIGEGGLLGLALHPDFARNNLLYLYLTTRSGEGLTNRVERYQLNNTALSNRTVIIEDIPGAQIHDGGRIAFGPDGKLYIGTGDAGQAANAQNRDTLAGKILRLNDDGSIPSDNPFGTAIYSFGHRNVQGLAWDAAGGLWATEHGRSGIASGFDEVNLIEPGTNYGWPEIQGNETQAGMRVPAAHSGPDVTWAPSGGTFLNGNLFFAGLKEESLYEAKITANKVTEVVTHFAGQFGRLRTATLGPDGAVYILTNNRDGRGSPKAGDDKIIRIAPSTLGAN